MDLIMKNEKEANLVVAKVMRITFLMFTFTYVLNVIGIFIVDQKIMTISYIIGAIILLLPTVLVKTIHNKTEVIKYFMLYLHLSL